MIGFKSSVIVEKLRDFDRLWRVYGELEFDNDGELITVPAGFITDFASVPRIFWTIFPPDGKYTAAAILHDFLYSIQDRSRKEVDRIFLIAMKSLKVPTWQRVTMYSAVRMLGWLSWNKKEAGQFNLEIG